MSALVSHHPSVLPWSRQALAEGSFVGFVPFSALALDDVPPTAGVYAVLRTADVPPTFLEANSAALVKGEDSSIAVDALRQRWIDGPQVLFVGKATAGSARSRGLRTRLDAFRRFGTGRSAAHAAGRAIWQLADRDELLLAWNATYEDAAVVDSRMLADFTERYGRLPFGNARR